MEKEKIKEEKERVTEDVTEVSFKIPDCCLELWESCPHVAPKLKKIKKNIAL